MATINLAVADTAVAGPTSLTFSGVVISDATAQAITPSSLTPGTITITGGMTMPPEPKVIPASPVWALFLLVALLVALGRRHVISPWRSAAMSVLALALLGPLAQFSHAQGIPGDANNDGVINAEDVRLIVERILERGVLSGDGDCNRDATINVLDTVCSQLPFVPGETAPIILGPGDRSIPAEAPFEMNLFAVDPDSGATLSWGLISGPAGLTVSSAGVLQWTPDAGDVGGNPVSVRVTDDSGRTDESAFAINVFAVAAAVRENTPPRLTVPADQSLPVGTPIAAQASASDPDAGDTLTFSLIDGPDGMTINPATGTLSWTPQSDQAGSADVVIQATDTGGASAFGTFSVTATFQNAAPTAKDDVYIARKGETLLIPADEGVLNNDTDPNGDSLLALQRSDPSLGTVGSFAVDGSFAYTPLEPERITIGLELKCETDLNLFSVQSGNAAAADVDGDGDVELVGFSNTQLGARVFIVDPTDCSVTLNPVPDASGQPSFTALSTLVNLDDDPELELVAQYFRFADNLPATPGEVTARLMAMNLDGTPVAGWPLDGLSENAVFDTGFDNQWTHASPVAVDLDGRGSVALLTGFGQVSPTSPIPNEPPLCEAIVNTTCNAVVAWDGRTGEILWQFVGGVTRPGQQNSASPVIVDLDMDGDPEIIWNQLVLDHEGNLLFDFPVEKTIRDLGNDFLSVAVANFDNDAYPEILGYDASNFYLFSHDGAIQWQRPYDSFSSGSGFSWGEITLAELDGDPSPEFVMMLEADGGGDLTVRAFDSDGEPLWDLADSYIVQISNQNRSSSPVAMDLDRDGIDELILVRAASRSAGLADAGLYILDGSTGAVIAFEQGTPIDRGDEPLTVADIDGDGSAEIVTGLVQTLGLGTLQVWDNLPGEPFPPARPIRSQTHVQPTWVNVDGSLPTSLAPHWLLPGRNYWNRIVPDLDPLEPERDSFTYRVSDGEFDSADATVNIEVRPNGNPPFFLSEPDRTTSVGISYRYLPVVVDVDPGDSVSFELIAGPAGMSLNPATGTLDWYPEINGDYPVSIAATDTLGLSSAQIFTLTVGDLVTVPDLVGLVEGDAADALTGAGLELGSRFFRSEPVVPEGQVVAQSPPAGSVAELGASVRVTISSGPGPADTDGDGDSFTPNEGDCNDSDPFVYPGAPEIDGDGIDQSCNGIDGNKTLVSIEVSPGNRRLLAGEPQPLVAMGIFEDGTAQNLTKIADWTRGPTFFSASAGDFTAEASFQGVTGSADFSVVARVDEDAAPIARIDAPGDGAELTAPTTVTGTVNDANRLRWEFAYRCAGEDDFVLFAERTNSVFGGPIAKFDPTTLLNGLYTLRLRVFDRGGNVSEDTTTVLVDSQLKVGNFTLRYVDLELPLNGIPITLVRNYDSRDKRVGDFGVGWRLGVESIELATNRELGSGWQVFRQGLTYGLAETDVHLAALRLPGGRIEAFRMVVTPNVSPIVPFPPFSQAVRFEPLPGTLGTLASLEANNVSILDGQPGPVTLRLDSDGSIYDPTLFRYTAPDGTQIDIDRAEGVQRVATPGGQVLTLLPTSIAHSNGTVVDIDRDALGRIVRITDPGGFDQTYSYDANGDLRSHSDQENHVTRYDYDAQHNIIRIVDPLDRPVLRNEYDDAGRLVSATNGNGQTTTFEHDIAGRQERVTDAAGFSTLYEYDDQGNVTRITDALDGVTTSTYDARGNLLSITNAEGETRTYTYDDRDNRLSETDPLGAVRRFQYDEANRVTMEEDPLGRQTQYDYDASGRLQAVVDPEGNSRLLTSDGSGNLVAETDKRGIVKRFAYNSVGFQTAVVDGRGHRLERSFDANGYVLSREDARGGIDTFSRDGRGLLTSVTAPEGNAMGFGFNALGELLSMQDAAGNSVDIAEDAAGNVISVVDPAGTTTRHFFDERGNRIRTVDGSGRETRYEYDALGRQVRVVFPGDGHTDYTYDREGRLLTETDAEGNVTTYDYDAAGRNTVLVNALGNRTDFSYDLAGNLVARLDARGHLTGYQYDALDRLVETTYPDGTSDSIEYDAVGNVVAETDRLGRTTSYRYDANSNLVSVTGTDGGITTYTYDENDNRISQTDANGHTTRMVYDANDRLVEKRYPDGSKERYEYNAVGQIASTILPDGKYIDAGFDGHGRPTGHDLNGEASESFVYDVDGRLTQAVNLWGTVEYLYGPDGQISEIRSGGDHTVRYTHDDRGNRTAVTTQVVGAPPRTTHYTYDALNRLETVVEPDGDTTRYGYDPVGNIASIDYPNGVESRFSYDSVNQLTRIKHRQGATLLAAYDYTLDDGGRRQRVDHANGDSVAFTYDSADRLTQETHRNSSGVVIFEQRFTYDAVGNRVTQQVSGQAQTLLAYDSADKLLSAGAVSFYYDPNGRLISRTAPQGTISYSYDVEGQLLRVTTSTGTVTYAYDARGKRRQRIAGGDEQNFLLDEASLTGYDQVLVAFDGNDESLTEYHWGDRLLSADDGGNDRYYHADAGGSTRLLTDEAGAVSDRYDYTAFGEVREHNGPADNPYGFAGEWQATAEDLVYLRARYYDPETGRFISRDPFGGSARDPVSLHRYLYANANPVMYSDPSGEVTLKEVAITASISAVISVAADLIQGIRDPKTIITNAFTSALFGAIGVGLAGNVAKGFAGVAASATRKGVVYAGIVFAKAAINTVTGIAAVASAEFLQGKARSSVSAGSIAQLFVINVLAEAVTLGIYRPNPAAVRSTVRSAQATRNLSAAASESVGGLRKTARKLLERLEYGDDAFELLRRFSSASGRQGRLARAQLDILSQQSLEILSIELTEGTARMFATPTKFNTAIESAKKGVELLWNRFRE